MVISSKNLRRGRSSKRRHKNRRQTEATPWRQAMEKAEGEDKGSVLDQWEGHGAKGKDKCPCQWETSK